MTLLTQIGGLVWVVNYGLYKLSGKKKSNWLKFSTFLILYILITILLVPVLAKLNGRVPLPLTKSGIVRPHNTLMPLLNRNYVKPRLKTQLFKIGKIINAQDKRLKVSYLDANFPFIDGFPLLPHLSHDDGRKVDISFYYKKDGDVGNFKPSNSGYGIFVEPLASEIDQSAVCKSRGHWQYDYARYITLGSRNDLEFDDGQTRKIIQLFVNDKTTHKIFIEPHLKKRMNLKSDKIRFQGCWSVRHDDHIHISVY